MMEQLAKNNPEEAKELARLRKRNPDEFRKVMRERLGRRLREHIGRRTGLMHPEGQEPFMKRGGRGGPGEFGGGRGGPAGGERRGGMMMRQRYAEHLEWLEENYPEEAEKLAELREKNPELHRRQMALCLRKYGRIAKASKENPELAKVLKEDLELKKNRDRLLRRIRAASGEKKQKLAGELEKVVSSRFDLIVKRKQIAYERLRKELNKLKKQVERSEAEVDKWRETKDKKVKERLEELISRTEKFKWD